MTARRVAILSAATLAGASALATRAEVRASDHLDGPRATARPDADITDVFAFTSPENRGNVVLAMAVTPYAARSSAFSSQVDYVFRVRRVTAPVPLTIDDSPLDVVCRFDEATPQTVTCTAPGVLSVRTTVGDSTGGGAAPSDPIRAFAGLRSDPAFFDRQGALATVTSGRPSFTGHNAFAGANVLLLLVELDARRAFLPAPAPDAAAGAGGTDAGPTMPILAVAAETWTRGG